MFEYCYSCSAPLPFHSPNTFAFVLVQKGIRNSLLSSTTGPKQNENEPYKGKSLQPAERESALTAVQLFAQRIRKRGRERVGCLALKWSTNRAFVLLSLLFMCMCFDLWMCVCVSACCRYTADFCNYAFVLLCCYFSLVFFCYTFFSSLVFEHATKFFSFEQLSWTVTFISSF